MMKSEDTVEEEDYSYSYTCPGVGIEQELELIEAEDKNFEVKLFRHFFIFTKHTTKS
jgi:hypothetical protein